MSILGLAGRVYNLSVEQTPEYFANGVLVHNCFWADELAAFKYEDAWDQLQFGLRLGDDPKGIVTTTPRPTPVIKSLIKDSGTVVTRGSTYENRGNLAPTFLSKIVQKYEGTRLGRQELYAELLDDAPGALWKRDQIDLLRIRPLLLANDRFETEEQLRTRIREMLVTVVVAIDPATTSKKTSNETGIIVVGLGRDNRHGYVLDDLSGRYTPGEWAAKAKQGFDEWEADRFVAEVNQGGDLVESNIRTVVPHARVLKVHAARGKRTRAEPVAALYEQGRVHHVGQFPELEDQQCQWEPDSGDDSPDRLDGSVWGVTDLMLTDQAPPPRKTPAIVTTDFESSAIG